ncbi:MAG: allantoicase [Polyangiales bacterium]
MSEPSVIDVTDVTTLVDLAAERVGGQALAASDEFFAEKENLLRAAAPIFVDGKYTDRGKWMDGWESRRSFGRVEGHTHDWCIVKLGLRGVVAGVDVDTRFFKGNFPESASIEACDLAGDPGVEQLLDPSVKWAELVPRLRLNGDASNPFAVAPLDACGRATGTASTHVRLKIFPDGGVARLRVYGTVVPDWRALRRFGDVHDLASVERGGAVVACNDMFFGSRHNLIMPGRSVNMGDGWETRRKRAPGSDWAIVRLGARASKLRVIEVDTNHFKGNSPESCLLEALDDDGAPTAALPARKWRPLLARAKLRPHTRHFFDDALVQPAGVTHVRLTIFPDGGVSRLRVHGETDEGAR